MQCFKSKRHARQQFNKFECLCQDLSLACRLFQASLDWCPFFFQAADLFMENLSAEPEKPCGSVISIKAIFKSEPDLPKQKHLTPPAGQNRNDMEVILEWHCKPAQFIF
jgi:hypothetical protein